MPGVPSPHIAGPHNGNVQKDGQIVIGRIQSQGHLVPLRVIFVTWRRRSPYTGLPFAASRLAATSWAVRGAPSEKGGLRQLEAVGLSVGGAAVALAQHRLRPVLEVTENRPWYIKGDERPVASRVQV